LSYCARHSSTAADDLAVAALNLLALTVPGPVAGADASTQQMQLAALQRSTEVCMQAGSPLVDQLQVQS